MRTLPCSLIASVAGSSFPAYPFSFTVHSVFPRAANLRPSGGGFLLSLVSDAAKAHPHSSVVPSARFEDWGLLPGDPGCFDGEVIRFGAGRGGGRAAAPEITLPRSRRPADDESPSRGRPRAESLRAAADAVEALRAERRAEPSLAELFAAAPPAGNGFSARFVRAARELERAEAARSVPLFLAAARKLAGFGPGLTPAGDDFLCGWFAGQRARAADRPGSAAFLDECGAAAFGAGALGAAALGTAEPGADALSAGAHGTGGLAERTNDISAAFLADAAGGRFGSALVAFADAVIADAAIAARSADEIANSVAVLGDLGHSSGTDAAAGFLFAYREEIGG
ncbi:MAG TPA: hypothetical protein DIC34_16970 [Treponema sp.]|nr:MAG: hypothetical protein A2001_16035 [Treponema sp. GWC1_61_84]HCM28199.1 hypothetical protein [Treponema sp.]